ncbi:ribonuclease E inhibitor RraA/Dimethylmenaquinone methyltransferase [Aspergillus terricola var. indicus]
MSNTLKALQALKQFSTCDIKDALVKLHFPYGGFLDGLRMRSPNTLGSLSTLRIYGPAVTVKMIEQPKGLYSACWGGLMSTRAKVAGALGVVVDGRVRDLSEHREIGFPDGVVVVPPTLMEKVVELCRERWEVDLKTMEALRKGQLMGPTMKRLRK